MSENPPAFAAAAGGENQCCQSGMTLRDWFATYAPPAHWRFMQDSKPSCYNPGAGEWSQADCDASYEAEAAWEMARDTAWRFHWADAMLAERTRSRPDGNQ